MRHVTTAPYYPQSNTAAERAVRTVKEALKKNKAGSLKCRLAKFLLRYRVTPVKDGKLPAEMLLGAQPRTRLSAHFPEREGTKETVKAAAPPSRLFLPGTRVWSRQYNRSGQRWLPGTVTAASGGRLLTVDTEEGEQRRHIDQVRLREAQQEASVTHSRESETDIGAESPLPHLHTGELREQTDKGAGTDQPASAVEDPVLPRRSTRKRRAPDRF
uniref:Tick transposon n=1 Tax=Rhipicephalus appendiculatus TaxID=34631 RepID=A0A131Z2M2_RHIAP